MIEYWNANTRGILAMEYYKLSTADSDVMADLIGRVWSTMQILYEMSADGVVARGYRAQVLKVVMHCYIRQLVY